MLTRDDKLEQLAQKAAAAANAPKRPVTKIDFSLFDPDYDGNRRARNTNIQQLRSRVESRQWPKRQGVANLHALLGIYQSWAAQLRPAISFDDFLKRTHRLGSTSMIRGLLAAEREGRVLHSDDLPKKRAKSESTDENKHNADEDEDDFELRLFDDEPAPTATTAEEMFDSLFGAGSSASLAPRGPSLLDEQQQPLSISDEQRARAEENRRKALERKNQAAAQKQQSQESAVGVLDDDGVQTVKRARTDDVAHEESND